MNENNNDFIYDDTNHTYFLNGVAIPSVSDVISPLKKNYEWVEKEVLERAILFGKATHKMIALHLTGELDEERLDSQLQPLLKGFKRWNEDYKLLKNPTVEKPMHYENRYAGTPDIVDKDTFWVVDIKTRAVDKKLDRLQLIAYRELAIKNINYSANWKMAILYLKQDGSYKFTEIKDDGFSYVWRALVDRYYNDLVIEEYKAHKEGRGKNGDKIK